MVLSKEVRNRLTEWEPMSARFESKCQNTIIIQVYAPTNEAEEEVKEDFYHQLQTAFNKRRETLTWLSAMLMQRWAQTTGIRKHLWGVVNENGKMFCDFCASNGLVIRATLFPHKKSHKFTWRFPDGTSENQIDHVAIVEHEGSCYRTVV